MKRAAVLLVCFVACGGKSKGEAGPAPTEAVTGSEPAAPLWSFAPKAWLGAAVVADGAMPTLDIAADEVRRIVNAVGSGSLLNDARSFFALEGIDVLDPSSLEAAGIDIGRGLALFITPQLGVVLALSVDDRDKLRTAFGGQSAAEGFDDFAGTLCKPARGRYLCASTRKAWDEIESAPSGSEDETENAPQVVIAAQGPDNADLVSTLGGPNLGISKGRLELFLSGGRLTWKANLDMPPPKGWLPARRRRPPKAFTSVDKTAFGFLRLRIPPRDLQSLPWPRRGPIDLRDVLAPELTGDLSVVSSGSHPLGMHFVAGLRDAGTVKLALRTTCRLASFAGYGSFRFRNGQCEGKVKLRKLGAPPALLTWLPAQLPVFIRITSSSAVVSIMVPMRPGLAVAQAEGRVAERLHDADWNLSAWGRWSDPEVVLTGRRAALFRGELARIGRPSLVAATRALMAHVYDAGFGLRATKTGVVLEGSVTTFGQDDERVYRAYSQAAIALGRGDVKSYRRSVSSLAGQYPGSLVMRQAAVRGIPIAPLAGLGAVLDRYGLRAP